MAPHCTHSLSHTHTHTYIYICMYVCMIRTYMEGWASAGCYHTRDYSSPVGPSGNGFNPLCWSRSASRSGPELELPKPWIGTGLWRCVLIRHREAEFRPTVFSHSNASKRTLQSQVRSRGFYVILIPSCEKQCISILYISYEWLNKMHLHITLCVWLYMICTIIWNETICSCVIKLNLAAFIMMYFGMQLLSWPRFLNHHIEKHSIVQLWLYWQFWWHGTLSRWPLRKRFDNLSKGLLTLFLILLSSVICCILPDCILLWFVSNKHFWSWSYIVSQRQG